MIIEEVYSCIYFDYYVKNKISQFSNEEHIFSEYSIIPVVDNLKDKILLYVVKVRDI